MAVISEAAVGWPASKAEARAAALIGRARLPLIAGLAADLDAIRAAFALADLTGAAVDPAAGDALADEMRAFADSGQMNTTPAEARHRADLVVVAGPAALAHAVAVGLFEEAASPLYPWRTQRKVLLVGCGDAPAVDFGPTTVAVSHLDADPAHLRPVLAALRAAAAGHGLTAPAGNRPTLAAITAAAAEIKAAAFGVLVYDPAGLGALGIELAQGLVKDMNVATRFTALTPPPALNGKAAALAGLWTVGLPGRFGMVRGVPKGDDWRFDGRRLVASGEADAVLWVGPLAAGLPDWLPAAGTVALVPPGQAAAAEVVIEVGVPGIDHGGTLYEARRDGLSYLEPAAPSARPRAAAVIGRLAQIIQGGAAC